MMNELIIQFTLADPEFPRNGGANTRFCSIFLNFHLLPLRFANGLDCQRKRKVNRTKAQFLNSNSKTGVQNPHPVERIGGGESAYRSGVCL